MTGPPGDHWHAVLREPGHEPLVYDSFGRGARFFRGRGTERDAKQERARMLASSSVAVLMLSPAPPARKRWSVKVPAEKAAR